MQFFYCQSISFGLEMKSFVVQRKYNFKDKRNKIVWYNLIQNVHKPNFDKCEYYIDHFHYYNNDTS